MRPSREINSRIAASYDLKPWSHSHPQAIAPVAVQLWAKGYGGFGRVGDILDLGCGTGNLLFQAGAQSTGRLVGTDISAASCKRARARLAKYGDRVEICKADILDLDPELIGKFDLIYCVGVLYVTPPDVRERILILIGQCLKPGGAALISYYTGIEAAVRAHLAKTLRSAMPHSQEPMEQARIARETLDLIRPALNRHANFTDALEHLDKSDDEVFFAENLNGNFDAISTAEISVCLQQAGVEFAT